MSPEELEYACENPKIELYPTNWVSTIPVISANDNMVSIQNGVSVDLTGQINAETILGGLAAEWSRRGSRLPTSAPSIPKGEEPLQSCVPAAVEGTLSCIIPTFEPGDIVTIPRAYADYVVTEFGVARLMGKTLRERAQALIAIAHPNFRDELKEQAKNCFGPDRSYFNEHGHYLPCLSLPGVVACYYARLHCDHLIYLLRVFYCHCLASFTIFKAALKVTGPIT